jgi:DNA-binding winged helix-turn-helix (wHTH) protein
LSHSITFYRFGPFELRVEQGVVLRDEERIPLSPQLFDLLLILIENHGNIVSKEKLIEKLWSGDKADKFLLDGRLQRIVSDLRNELECGKELIETQSKVGYRFIAPVTKDSTLANEMESESPLYTQLIERINRISDMLPKSASPISGIIANEIISSWETNLREISSKGIKLSRIALQDCVDKLFEEAKSIAVIDSRCFDPNKEWNQYWVDWLVSTKDRVNVTDKKYFMLYELPLEPQDAHNLNAAAEILRSVGFSFYICDRVYLNDFLKPELPDFDALNIFGQLVVRKKILPDKEAEKKTAFAGGHPLWFWLHDMDIEKNYAELYRLIMKYSKEGTSDLIEKLTVKEL